MLSLEFILGALTLVISGVAALMLGTLKTLRDSNRDLRDRVTDLEAKTAAQAAAIVVLTNDRDALGRQVRGDDALATITEKLDDHHREAKVHWRRDEELLADIRARMARGRQP